MILAPILKERLQENIENKTTEKQIVKEPEITKIQKASEPIIANRTVPVSKYNIQQKLDTKEEEQELFSGELDETELPNNHFTDTDLHTEWKKFLEEIEKKDIVIHQAINSFKLQKVEEDTIKILYPSDTAKAEFDKVSVDFFNAFKHKVNHNRIRIEYKMDFVNLKKEIITKRSIFEKFAQINPVLRDLDDLLKFDFNQ